MLTLLWLGVTALLIRRNSLWTPVAAAALTVAAAALLNRRRRTAPAAGPGLVVTVTFPVHAAVETEARSGGAPRSHFTAATNSEV